MLPLAQYGTYPIELLGAAVLVIGLGLTAAWILYFFR